MREQFGRAIGSFQAVKHHCTDMLVDAELATAVTWDACCRAATADETDLGAAAAAWALPAFQGVAEVAIQVHGGISYTWEHDAHLDLRRASALLACFGPEAAAREDVVRLRLAGARRGRAVDLPADADAYRGAAQEFREEHGALPVDERRAPLRAGRGISCRTGPHPTVDRPDRRSSSSIDEELSGLERPSLGLGEWILSTVLHR